MPLSKEQRYTAEEFFELVPETNEQMELIGGQIVAQAAPGTAHQRISRRIVTKFEVFISGRNGSCEVFDAPYDVKLDMYNVVQPDIFVVCDPDKIDDKRCNGVPDFVIEIVSSNKTDDYSRKLELYKKFGVKEYWIIDPGAERTVVYIFGEFTSVNIYAFDQAIPVGIWGGALSIVVGELV